MPLLMADIIVIQILHHEYGHLHQTPNLKYGLKNIVLLNTEVGFSLQSGFKQKSFYQRILYSLVQYSTVKRLSV